MHKRIIDFRDTTFRLINNQTHIEGISLKLSIKQNLLLDHEEIIRHDSNDSECEPNYEEIKKAC